MSEDLIQQQMFMWHWNAYPSERGLLFHVPNENQHRKIGIGVVAGVSDLIYLKNNTAYLIEVKTATGKQSPKQRKWENLVRENGYQYFVVRSLEEFKTIVKKLG